MLTIRKYSHLPYGQRRHFKEKDGFEKIFLLKLIQMGAILFANMEWKKISKGKIVCICMFAHLYECACAW